MKRPSVVWWLRVVVLVVGLVAVGGVSVLRADTCKSAGTSCRTNQSCCSGVCAKGSGSFGTCCAPTTCAIQGASCGSISDGCGRTLDCGTCTAPATCGGGGTANVCGTSTTTTTTNTTTTTAPSCASSDAACMTSCTSSSDCPDTRTCVLGRCEPKLTDHRACLVHTDCQSDCCCGEIPGFSGDCGAPPQAICREPADCDPNAGNGVGCECPGLKPCGDDENCHCPSQFCAGGLCFQKQEDGAGCATTSACGSECCCAASGQSTGQCSSATSCAASGGACLPCTSSASCGTECCCVASGGTTGQCMDDLACAQGGSTCLLP